jgi:GT2 family glycosyltransferase
MNFPTRLPVHLSVSIVLYKCPLEEVLRTLHSLQQAAHVAREAGCLERATVYLVDNASGAVYRQRLEEALASWQVQPFVELVFVPQATNHGFGHGHNQVLSRASSDVHLVLNPDVELEQRALQIGIMALLNDGDIALLSPRANGGGGQQEFLCKRYPSVLILLVRGFAPGCIRRLFRARLADYETRDLCRGDEPADITIASGCFMLVRTAALREVAGFDETFFLYFEDFDLSLRLHALGRLVYHPGVQIVHHGGYAAGKGLRHVMYFVRSAVTFFNRHGWRWI